MGRNVVAPAARSSAICGAMSAARSAARRCRGLEGNLAGYAAAKRMSPTVDAAKQGTERAEFPLPEGSFCDAQSDR
jgi:hypothetical protein